MRHTPTNIDRTRASACEKFGKVAFTTKNISDLRKKSDQTGIPIQRLMDWSIDSVHELRDKEQRVKNFYEHRLRKDPDNWFLLPPAHDYWSQFKTEDKKRKNKVQTSGLHEIDPVLWCIRLIQAGILPDKVTYEIVDGQRRDIPPEQQSIQHLLATLFTHDAHEDFPLSARARLLHDYKQALGIDTRHPISAREQFELDSLLFHADATDAITFKLKKYDGLSSDGFGKTFEESCFKNDNRQLYSQAMIPNWAAIAAKGVDRMGGMIMRFDQIPDTFTYERQKEYYDETEELFMYQQVLENMQQRYPELDEFFEIVNANFGIAFRAIGAGLKLHTGKPKEHPNPESVGVWYDPEMLDKASWGRKYIELDLSPMYKLQTNFGHMADRKPRQSGIHADLERQFKPYIADHPITPIQHTTRIRRIEPQAAIA